MPTILMPDRSIPPDWWDHYIFRDEFDFVFCQKIANCFRVCIHRLTVAIHL